jgi:hypothetical protein
MVGQRSPQGFEGVGFVGPLLAVLMSLQQGRGGVRSLIVIGNTGFSRDIARSRNVFGQFRRRGGPPVRSTQRPNTALAAIMNRADFRTW